jgi:hypothetical protein
MGVILMQPRFIRLRDVPAYLGMDINRFNREVRPFLIEIPIGKQGIAFDRLDFDRWADHHKRCNGRPVSRNTRRQLWEKNTYQGYSRKPYPLNWEEQNRLFEALPNHLREMALFAVNTGCRDREVCGLQWEWEVKVPISEIGSVFLIPGERVKNGEDRLVLLNSIARKVIQRLRGKHPKYVFVYRGKPINRMLNNGWRKARKLTDLSVRVHDLKHTFGRRLRSAGVSFEDRQDLLGHKSARITTHYSSAELLNLWEAINKICDGRTSPTLTLLRQIKTLGHEKVTEPI